MHYLREEDAAVVVGVELRDVGAVLRVDDLDHLIGDDGVAAGRGVHAIEREQVAAHEAGRITHAVGSKAVAGYYREKCVGVENG